MAEFMNDPVLTLEGIEDVRKAIEQPRKELCGFKGLDIYLIKSTWLIGLIDEIAARGEYPYNATVKQLAEQRLGLPARSYAELSREGDALSLLIYNAQNYRRSDKLRADGYQPFTGEVLAEAHRLGKKLELFSDGLMGSSVRTLNVREINGNLYAVKPRTRSKHIPPLGQPVRIAA